MKRINNLNKTLKYTIVLVGVWCFVLFQYNLVMITQKNNSYQNIKLSDDKKGEIMI